MHSLDNDFVPQTESLGRAAGALLLVAPQQNEVITTVKKFVVFKISSSCELVLFFRKMRAACPEMKRVISETLMVLQILEWQREEGMSTSSSS